MDHDILLRAPRLPLRAPITCRTSPARSWEHGWTINISRSGVLFTLPQTSARSIDGDLEFVINLSRGAMQGPGVALLPDLLCRGRVVRATAGPGGEVVVAASIRRQSLRRAAAPSAPIAPEHLAPVAPVAPDAPLAPGM